MADKCTNDIDDMRRYYESKYKAAGVEKAKEIISKHLDKKEDKEPEKSEPEVNYDLQQVTDYTQFYASNAGDKKPSATVIENEEPTCRIIDDSEYEEDDVFDKGTLYYYKIDGVLADVDDMMVSLNLLGGEELIKEAIEQSSTNIFFISNSEEETNYEVLVVDQCYAEDVLGHPDQYGHVVGGVND